MELQKNRFTTLDIFRGMTICFMIIVNSPGSGAAHWAPFTHAQWFGFTPTDLVFPSFLFAVGNALSFSSSKLKSAATFWKKIIKRSLLIFLLGFLMYWFPFFHRTDTGWAMNAWSNTRIMGVLQRIAICYFFGAITCRYLSVKSTVIVSVVILVAYQLILYTFGEPGSQYTMLGNAGTWIDNALLGKSHMYRDTGGPLAFDPEGLLSCLTGIVNVTAGFVAGVFIQKKGRGFELIAKLLICGAVLVLLALCWNPFFPISKKLWTSPFTLLTVGIDLTLIGTLIYLYELKHYKSGSHFFQVFGRNPLVIYLLSELLLVLLKIIWVKPRVSFYDWINKAFFQRVFPGPLGTHVFAVCFMLLCWLVGYIMDKKKVYIRI